MSYQDDQKVYRSAGGPYWVTAETYEEMADYGVGPAFGTLKGQRHKFKWKVEGNKWFHTGQFASGLTIEEVWERVVDGVES